MALKQKYIEDEFELDEVFYFKLKDFVPSTASKIIKLIDDIKSIEETGGEIYNISGYVNDKENTPVFFMIDYFTEDDQPILLLDIHQIDLDTYLDQINLNRYIKNNDGHNRNNKNN